MKALLIALFLSFYFGSNPESPKRLVYTGDWPFQPSL
jgi:hypothetical protein